MRAAIYARVSTFDQEPEHQLAELRRYGRRPWVVGQGAYPSRSQRSKEPRRWSWIIRLATRFTASRVGRNKLALDAHWNGVALADAKTPTEVGSPPGGQHRAKAFRRRLCPIGCYSERSYRSNRSLAGTRKALAIRRR